MRDPLPLPLDSKYRMQGSRGRRIRCPGTKKIGFGCIALVSAESPAQGFFAVKRHNLLIFYLGLDVYLAAACPVASEDSYLQSTA